MRFIRRIKTQIQHEWSAQYPYGKAYRERVGFLLRLLILISISVMLFGFACFVTAVALIAAATQFSVPFTIAVVSIGFCLAVAAVVK